MSARVVVQRSALKGLLAHAAAVARESRREALGWLLGFFTEDAVYVADSAGCTRYRSQTRHGAEADPAEEAELALRYPRSVGIVGVYHSHPFEDTHAIFHSHTDDAMLRSRSSRRPDYLSVVTDTRTATFYVLRRGKPVEVTPEVVEDLDYGHHLRRYAARVPLRVSAEAADGSAAAAVSALEGALRRRIEAATSREGELREEEGGAAVHLTGLDEGVRSSAVRFERAREGLRADLEVLLHPAVFASREDGALLKVIGEEADEDATFLLRQAVDGRLEEIARASRFEAPLGTIKVQEHRRLPFKVYRPPKRGPTVRR